jgi:sodium-coupled neutral amino acid transporter 10
MLITAGVTLLGALPVGIFVRDHAVVAMLSTASVGCVLVFAAVIVVLAMTPAAPAAAAAAAADGAAKLLMWQPDGLLVAFPVMAYGFTAHPYYLGIYAMLPSPNVRRMGRVTDLVRTNS